MATWPYNSSTWKRLRRAKLATDPLCHPCRLRGRLVTANTVDHVTAIADGGEPFPDLAGLMSMCSRCHNDKTNAVDRPDRHGSGRRFKGFDVDGNPIDPGDDWHRGLDNHQESRRERPAGNSRFCLVSNRSKKGGAAWG